MTSKDVKEIYEKGEILKLYKQCQKYFDLIDGWAETFISGDVLSEEELKYAMQQINGCQTKLNVIAGALESLTIEYENNYYLKEESTFDKIRMQDKDHCKAFARASVSDLRSCASDFTRYVQSAQGAVVTAQSLLKRYAIEKGNKGIGWTGDKSHLEDNQINDDEGWS